MNKIHFEGASRPWIQSGRRIRRAADFDDRATIVDVVNMVRSTSEHNGEERGYHHGNLREALVEAGVALARTGGPNAVLLRAASRQAGVSHNAVYRHFANQEDLLAAVAERCMTQLGLLMIERSTRVTARGPVPRARARLEAIGRAYIDFARTEPGWFRTAFSSPAPRRGPTRAPADRAVPKRWAVRTRFAPSAASPSIVPSKVAGEPHVEHSRLTTQTIATLANRGYAVAQIAAMDDEPEDVIGEAIDLELQLATA